MSHFIFCTLSFIVSFAIMFITNKVEASLSKFPKQNNPKISKKWLSIIIRWCLPFVMLNKSCFDSGAPCFELVWHTNWCWPFGTVFVYFIRVWWTSSDRIEGLRIFVKFNPSKILCFLFVRCFCSKLCVVFFARFVV